MTSTVTSWDDNIQLLFEKLAELPCEWRDKRRSYIPETYDGMVTLRVASDVGVGIDETRTDYNAAAVATNEEIEPTQCGLRTVSLEVDVETFDHEAQRSARFYLNRIRSRLRRPSSLAALRVVDSALIDIQTIAMLDHIASEHAFSRGMMEVRLHVVDSERDAAYGRIDVITGTASLENAEGTVVATEALTIDLPDP